MVYICLMKDDPTIRAEEAGDVPGIGRLVTLAFGQDDEARLVDAIRQEEGFDPRLSLVASEDGALTGHVLLSPILIRSGSGNVPALSLAPVSVLPERQGEGIGSRLTERALETARELGHRIVVVIGHPSYYPRFGFTPAREKGLEVSWPVPDEAFMVMELAAGALEGIEGEVVFPPAFDAAM
jgi:putative acetyltransferase